MVLCFVCWFTLCAFTYKPYVQILISKYDSNMFFENGIFSMPLTVINRIKDMTSCLDKWTKYHFHFFQDFFRNFWKSDFSDFFIFSICHRNFLRLFYFRLNAHRKTVKAIREACRRSVSVIINGVSPTFQGIKLYKGFSITPAYLSLRNISVESPRLNVRRSWGSSLANLMRFSFCR